MKKITHFDAGLLFRGLAALLCLCLLMTGAVTTALASPEPPDTEAAAEAASPTVSFVSWTYHESVDSLQADFPDGTTVRYSPLPFAAPHLRFAPGHRFVYEEEVTIEGLDYTITSATPGGDSLYLFAYENGESLLRMYFSESGAARFSALMEGEGIENYRLAEGDEMTRYANVTNGYAEGLLALATAEEAAVMKTNSKELRYAPYYEVQGFDEDSWLGVTLGFIYCLEDVYYFLDTTSLAESSFREDGSLKVSEGIELTLYELDEDSAYDTARYAGELHTRYCFSDYESGNDFDFGTDEDTAITMAYFSVVLMGILLPIAPLAVGLALPHAKSPGNHKRWYLLAALGGGWLLIGVAVLVIMIVML